MRKNQIIIRLVSTFLAAAVAFSVSPSVYAAEGKTYQVIYKAGNVGEFTSEYQEYATGTLGAVSADEKKIVYEVKAGEAFPQLPQAGNIASEGYFAADSSQWGPEDDFVTRRSEFVVQYGRLVDGVEYTVRFVDAASGEQVALPEIAMGNVGEEVTYTAKSIPDYSLVSEASAAIVLDADATLNIITFTYASTKTTNVEEVVRTEYVDGGTTVVYSERENIIYQQSNTAQPGGNVQGAAGEDGNEAQQGNVNIEDEETPLGDGTQVSDEDGDIISIEEEEAPLSGGSLNRPNMMVVFAGIAGAAAIALAAVWFLTKKKAKEQDAEEQ